MASRMDRYSSDNEPINKRSSRNHELYRDIYEESDYSNIEGVASIEKTNEIDITKIKSMLQNREEYQKKKKYQPDDSAPVRTVLVEPEEEKNYDLKEVLNKAKSDRPKQLEDYRSLRNTQYNILKSISLKNEETYKDEELEELIHTITNTSMLNKMNDGELSLNMLNDLDQTNTKTIARTQAVRTLIEEDLKLDSKNSDDLDHSFYTSSLNFGKKDFEEVQEQTGKKESKILLYILLAIITVLLLAVIALLIYKFVL